ncbi:endonuclease [Bacillus sp. AGMB 02131]|uniref:Endonuclease n=1 Tax=Peribacillus faecalis TaxID=2772559 RepID=A0A927CVB0_9BACI|nr:endonuclease [Peribacillus faecalis]MBD3107741.1 endonuclease [Peribacillus faecalis]
MKNFWKRTGKIFVVLILLLGFSLPNFNGLFAKAETVISVADAIANNSGTATVEGYIVAYTLGTKNYTRDPARFNGDTNIAIADSPSETDPSKIMPVQITNTGNWRTTFGLQSNPSNIGKKVRVTGTLEAYFTVPGLRTPTAMSFVDGSTPDPEPEPENPELKTIAEIRGTSLDTKVATTGIVTAVFGGSNDTVYIQDDTAGIVLYGPNLGLEVGDQVEAQGNLTEYSSLLEIVLTKNDIKVIGKTDVPEATIVKASELREEIEGMLLSVENVKIVSVSGANYTAEDSEGTRFIIRTTNPSLFVAGKTYDSITGALGAFNNVYQLLPRGAEDVIENANKVQAVTANPPAGFIKPGTEVTLSTATDGATIHYTLNDDTPTAESATFEEPIVIDENVVIKAIALKDGMENSDVATFNYMLQEGEVRIHDIQGISHYSLYDGQNVSDIEGIVTHVASNSEFYMQDLQPDDDDQTSEGILVYRSGHGKKVGDIVKVTGEVKEYYRGSSQGTDLPITEIAASSITTVSSNNELPEPIVIGKDRIPPTVEIDSDSLTVFNPEVDGIDFYESIEGMLIEIEDPKIVAPVYSGELVVVAKQTETNTNAGGLKLTAEDGNPERLHIVTNSSNLVAKAGDYFNEPIKGIMSYSNSNFKVLLSGNLPQIQEGATKQEITSIEKVDDQLTIATYNIENFSATTSAAKVTKIAQSIITNLKSPDIIGLTEVQDNNGATNNGETSADQTAQVLINKIKELGGSTYVYTDVAPVNNQDGGQPGGNIRPGFLYNPERVTLAEGSKGKATEAVAYADGKLSVNPGVIDPTNAAFESSRKPLVAQFEFQDESVIVIANHFNSKSGDQPLFGSNQPPVLSSEVQRNKIAAVVNGFVKSVQADNPEANVVVVGDFNDFEFSNPMNILKGNELTNMIDAVPFEKRYTYSYQGNSQVLDHILVSNNLASSTIVDIPHLNSSLMEEHGRASDHDPVLIQTKLKNIPVKTYAKTFNLTGFKTNKLSVNTPDSLVDLDQTSIIADAIYLKYTATLKGDGLRNTKVVISSASAETIIDITGAEVKEVVIENADIKEIHGAENVQKWTVADGVDTSKIKFFDSKGKAIASPFVPESAIDIILKKQFPNVSVQKGTSHTINLNEYFQSLTGLKLNYSTTIGFIEEDILTLPVDEEGNYIIAVTASNGSSEFTTTFSLIVSSNSEIDSYYRTAVNKTGSELKAALHNIIKEHTKLTYSQVWDALKETDEDPANSNNVILLYANKSISKSSNGGNVGQWNREHVWPQSHGNFGTNAGPGTDLHNLKPEDVQANSSRGNKDFDNGGQKNRFCECYTDSDSWEPPDHVKGDVARMMFYMAVRYEGAGELDLELVDYTGTGSNPILGKLSTLIEWNELDPVDDFERNRNNIIYSKWQHNRNPFIDYPEWAEEIWGAAINKANAAS